MISSDGIEVYLKPRGQDADGLRFPELPIIQDESDTDICHLSRFYVPAVDEDFQVVIRFPKNYDMFSAGCLSTGISYKDGTTVQSRFKNRNWSVRGSRIPGQQFTRSCFSHH